MGGDCGSWPHQPLNDGRTHDFNSTSVYGQPHMGLEKHFPTYMDPWTGTVANNGSFSLPALGEPPQPGAGNAEPHGWFYCLSNFRQALAPPTRTILKEHHLIEPLANIKKDNSPNAVPQLTQKQFLVFDQTGDQTTMIFASGNGTPPMKYLTHWKKNQTEASKFHGEQGDCKELVMCNPAANLSDNRNVLNGLDEEHGGDVQSEMHEDTEELNALMYSDNDTDGDEDEDDVTSTGHSPSSCTENAKEYDFAEIIEEVASSDEEPTKRQKTSHEGYGRAQAEGHITVNQDSLSFHGDTESHSGSGKVCDSGKAVGLPGKKRTRKDLVRETVHALQSVIPGGKGATPIEVIDEAIHFLVSLKLKANSLGIDSM